MAVNKVIYGNQTLIDLTQDTVEADKLLEGFTAHKADGTQIVGTASGGGGGKQLVLYERGTSHLGEVQKSSMSTYLATFGNDGITYNQYSTASSDFITKIPIDITDWDVLRVYGALAGNETSDTYKRYLIADLKSARMAAGKNEVYFTLQRTGNNFYAYLSPSTAPSVYTNGACVFSGSNYVKIFKIWLERFDETVVSAFTVTVEALEGSVVTCTKDGIVLSKTVDSSQRVTFDVPEPGAWIISDGTNSKTVTFDSQDKQVSFLFNPVLYELGTFNAEFENPGEFIYNATGFTRQLDFIRLNSNCIYIRQPGTSKTYCAAGFSNLINLSSYSKIRVYRNNANLSNYVEFDISSLSGLMYIGLVTMRNAASRFMTYIVFSTDKDLNTGTQYILVNSNSQTAYYIYKIELM